MYILCICICCVHAWAKLWTCWVWHVASNPCALSLAHPVGCSLINYREKWTYPGITSQLICNTYSSILGKLQLQSTRGSCFVAEYPEIFSGDYKASICMKMWTHIRCYVCSVFIYIYIHYKSVILYIYIYIILSYNNNNKDAIIVLHKSHFFRGQNGANGGIAGPLRGEGQWWFGGHLDSDWMNPKPWKYVSTPLHSTPLHSTPLR